MSELPAHANSTSPIARPRRSQLTRAPMKACTAGSKQLLPIPASSNASSTVA